MLFENLKVGLYELSELIGNGMYPAVREVDIKFDPKKNLIPIPYAGQKAVIGCGLRDLIAIYEPGIMKTGLARILFRETMDVEFDPERRISSKQEFYKFLGEIVMQKYPRTYQEVDVNHGEGFDIISRPEEVKVNPESLMFMADEAWKSQDDCHGFRLVSAFYTVNAAVQYGGDLEKTPEKSEKLMKWAGIDLSAATTFKTPKND